MLDIFTVSFFGHRDFSEHLILENTLENILKRIISEHEYIEFLIGRNGEFDQFISSTIRKLKPQYTISIEHILVLPYTSAELNNNEQSFRQYYDRIEVFTSSTTTHFKAQIRARNDSMILRSNLVICYVAKSSGGAYNALRFADKNMIPVINLADYIEL